VTEQKTGPQTPSDPEDAPETPPTEPEPAPVQDPPAEPNPVPYVVRGQRWQTPKRLLGGGTMTDLAKDRTMINERKERRGFASMSPEKQREIASKGGRAAHQKGTAHEWTSDEARNAGRKGGQISRGGRGRLPEAGGMPTPPSTEASATGGE
jgi:uncharacterized protein